MIAAAAVAAITIIFAQCPYDPETLGCSDLPERIIYVDPKLSPRIEALTLAHERGHFFEWDNMNRKERKAVMRSQGWGTRWYSERFADLYATCQFPASFSRGHGFGRRDVELCAVVRRIG